MKPEPLSGTNPHLSDPKQYEKLLIVNVTSSTAVEIGAVKPSILQALRDKHYPLLINPENLAPTSKAA